MTDSDTNKWLNYIEQLSISDSMSIELQHALVFDDIKPNDLIEALLIAYFWHNDKLLKIIHAKINKQETLYKGGNL